MHKTVNKLWLQYKNILGSESTKHICAVDGVPLGYGLLTAQNYNIPDRQQHRLLATIVSAGLQDVLYPERNNPTLEQIVAKTIEEKKQKQYTTLLSMFPCVQWLRASEWIYNPTYKHSLVVLQSVVNNLAQSTNFQKTYQDSDLEGREYQRPIADVDEADCLSLSEYGFPSTMRLQRIMSGEALVTKQRAKTKRTVGRLLLLDTSHSMTQWLVNGVQRWVYALAVIIDSLNNLQKYGGVLHITSFANDLTEYGQITVANAVQWLADEIKPYGTWINGNDVEFFPYVKRTLSSISADDLELVVVTDGEIPVPTIDLGATKCHVFGMASDNPKLQKLTEQTNGVYVRLDRL